MGNRTEREGLCRGGLDDLENLLGQASAAATATAEAGSTEPEPVGEQA